MKTYEISNTTSGATVWTGEAKSVADALDAMSREAGYASHAQACITTDDDGSDLLVREVDADEVDG